MKYGLNKRIGKSGEKFIYYDTYSQKYRVQIPIKDKQTSIGKFEKLEDAIICRDKALSS